MRRSSPEPDPETPALRDRHKALGNYVIREVV